MADLDFTVNANTNRAQQNLQNLERNVESVGSAFTKLKGVLAGLVAASTVRGLFEMSNALADLSATTNVSIQSIAGLGEALAQNGGKFDQANTAILRFTETLGEAFQGSDKTRDAFARVGVSLEDLRTLSEQDLLRKTIIGLGQITDTGTRASLATELFGRTLRGVDLTGVANNLDRITENQRDFASSAERAGAVNQSFSNSFRLFQNQLLEALEPFAKLAESIVSNERLIKNFIETVISLAKVLIALAGARVALQFLGRLSNEASKTTGVFSKLLQVIGSQAAWKQATLGVKILKAEKLELLNIFRKTGAGAEANASALKKLLSGFGGLATGVARFLPLLGKLFIAFEALNFITKQFTGESIIGWLDRAGKAVANLFGIQYKTAKEKEQLDRDEAARQRELAAQEQDRAARTLQDSERQRREAAERAREEERITTAYRSQLQTLRDSLTAYSRGNEEVQRRLRQEIALIGLTDDQKMRRQSMFEMEENYQRELTRLQDLYNEKSASGKREDMRLLPDILRAMDDLNVRYREQVTAVQALTDRKIQALEVEKQRLEIERQAQSLADFTNRTRLATERQIRDIQAEIARSTMTDIEKKYFDIARASKESAREAIQAENDRRRAINAPLLTTDEQRKYYEAAAEGNEQLILQTERLFDQSRKFSTGWRQAFNEYVDNATNSARQAQRIFERTTKGMEDAIVNFAKTGRFEFRNFVNMILEEVLRIQIQRTFANLFGGSTGSSGGFGRLMGFANGGIIPTDRPVLVGERGPELLVGASGNRVIPNDQLGSGTQVTYNINAVDASSFKEMLARDPSFLYAVTEQGRRRAPGTRR